MMEMVGCIFKEGTKSGALEPLPSVEELGTGVLHAYLALLDGDHIGETSHYPGAICKHRHFWLITETMSASTHTHKASQRNSFSRLVSLSLQLFYACFQYAK